MIAWALAEEVKTRRSMGAAKDLESISTNNKDCMEGRRSVAGSARDTGTEESVL
jgi:hypothetical protein